MGTRGRQLIQTVISAVAAASALSVSTVFPADAGTNFPALSDYPAPACVKPGSMPALPTGSQSSHAANETTNKIAQYGAAQQAYIGCMNAYVARSKADLDLIRSKVDNPTPNFPALKDYPAPDCGPPVSMPVPPNLGKEASSYDWTRATRDYNAQSAKYDVYASCVNAYTANAQADMDLIVDKVNRAVDGASAAPAADDPNNWVTFKTGDSAFGPTQHQVNRKSIRQEGSYRTFWTRIWIVPLQQGLVHSDVVEERLTRWSQKFAVDCAHHKWGPQFIDSTDPSDRIESASVETMHWVSLDETPVIAKVVCAAPVTASP